VKLQKDRLVLSDLTLTLSCSSVLGWLVACLFVFVAFLMIEASCCMYVSVCPVVFHFL